MTRFNIGVLGALGFVFTSGCVVTTFEAPGDPPRVLLPPEPKVNASSAPTPASTPEPGEPSEVSARHILISYQGSLRASPSVTRSKAEAAARAEQALARAKAGEKFEDLVKEYSDEPGAAERGGSLGNFQRGMMVPAFENAAFKLGPGELSGVVETQFGFHVILRTE